MTRTLTRTLTRTTTMALLLLVSAALAAAAPADVVPLHPAVGDTVDAREAARWGLFPDVPGLTGAVFAPGPRGGFLARLTVAGDPPGTTRERNVPRAQWERWRRSLDAGEAVAGYAPAVDRESAVWPEVPLPPVADRPAGPRPGLPPPGDGPPGRWLLLTDLGWKHATTAFGDYFTDMLRVSVALGLPLGENFLATAGLQLGLGDLQDDFEDLTGNGRAAHYGIELGARALLPVGERTDAVLGVRGGYYLRSLRWGGALFWGYGTVYQSGSLVRELSDWGGGLDVGLRRQLGDAGSRRWLAVTLHAETCAADPVLLQDSTSGDRLLADDHDDWIGVSVGLIMGI
ncbi:MAG: hypothetical protein Q7W56_14055 [Candidatus Latescibacteria bacterium]|nr:hypothetical protein [Candidatus Latescibacterota bacterium]